MDVKRHLLRAFFALRRVLELGFPSQHRTHVCRSADTARGNVSAARGMFKSAKQDLLLETTPWKVSTRTT